MASRAQDVFFVKGHGTGNDFVVLPDPDAELDLTAQKVQQLCHRRTGIGADGVLRVVRSAKMTDADPLPPEAQWFMDYRNADGTTAEMCGNGSRVFASFLIEAGWASGEFVIGTRSGAHQVRDEGGGTISVDMGRPVAGPDGPAPTVRTAAGEWTGDAWWLPNPHAVVFVSDLSEIGDLAEPPEVQAGQRFPDGQNVEFAVDTSAGSDLSAHMRVFERGVGQTLSCGTGACAVALSVRSRHNVAGPGSVGVTVPGGELSVRHDDGGRIWLRGPVALVAQGAISGLWWQGDS